MPSWLSSLITTLALASLVVYGVAQLCLFRLLRKKVKSKILHTLPAVTILKPLSGVDEELDENLRSILSQDYPRFEVIFGVEHSKDESLKVAAKIRREFPHVPVTINTCVKPIGINPKVNNLASMIKKARYDYVLISDANVRVQPDYLRCMVGEKLQPNVGLVCNLIKAGRAKSLGAHCEDLQLNTFVAAAISSASLLMDQTLVVGKSMLFHRQEFQKLGGFQAVSRFLAEDYVVGQAYHRAGYDVVLSTHLIEAVHVKRDLKEFLSRHIRWSQMRWQVNPLSYFLEVLAYPTFWGLVLGVFSWRYHLPEQFKVAVLITGAKIALDMLMDREMTKRTRPLWIWLCVPLKDTMMLYAWLIGLFRRSIVWRGHSMTISKGSYLKLVEDQALFDEQASEYIERYL